MARFKLTTFGHGHSNVESKDIEAHRFDENGSFTIFYNEAKERMYAVPTGNVVTIERLVESAK
ncbi:hypothetical protein ACTXG7_24885 [Mycolicibacterium sp. Dal123E01]|uniref:hypothetical protein n=1 Tax=Mycolicibacterium sp. Dal123E01 TaxID=3457578 RepID=UPI00403E98E7